MLLLDHAEYIRAHPSLIVVGPDDDEATLRSIAPRLADFSVMLGIREPSFARRLPEIIASRLALLGRKRVDVLTLWVDQIMDLKSGNILQTLFKLRDQGVAGDIGLAHHDIRDIEWLATHTSVRLLVLPYGLEDQSARYRALDAARQYGMACVAMGGEEVAEWPSGQVAQREGSQVPSPKSQVPSLRSSIIDHRFLRFSLAESPRALPVLDSPIPEGDQPMTPAEVEQSWSEYTATHPPPAPLPRGGPPEV